MVKPLYERAIAEADKRRLSGEPGAEDALRAFWTGYVDFLVRDKLPRNLGLGLDAERFRYSGRKASMMSSCFSPSAAACEASRLRVNFWLGICASWCVLPEIACG